MIYGRIDRLEDYKGLYGNLDKAIDYILNTNFHELAVGKSEVSGDEIYVNRIEGSLIDEMKGVYEFHRKYLDIHIDIDGTEEIFFSEFESEDITEEYRDDVDYGLVKGKCVSTCKLDQRHFVICMLEEPHMPCIRSKGTEEGVISKVVIKVRAS